MPKISALLALSLLSAGAVAQNSLSFDASQGVEQFMDFYDGSTVRYTAYEHLYYVTNVEDSTYQYLNVYVPEGATQQTPILMRTYVGGYMASAATQPKVGDATGRALWEGYVVVIPGSRGRNSSVTATAQQVKALKKVKGDKRFKSIKEGDTLFNGRAPQGILDLKAAVRYLRQVDKEMPGDAERIITDGTSAGGAMSALLGATGNNPEYEAMLDAMGAAKQRDDVYASVCYCPIIDLEHADMAYEWMYGPTDSRRALDSTQQALSMQLGMQFNHYLDSLQLVKPDSMPLNGGTLIEYIKSELIASAQIAKNAGAEIPDTIGMVFSSDNAPRRFRGDRMMIKERPAKLTREDEPQMLMRKMTPEERAQRKEASRPKNMELELKKVANPHKIRGGAQNAVSGMPGPMMMRRNQGEYITELDMRTYVNYVASCQPLKGVPAFDSMIQDVNEASGENELFGSILGEPANFTDFSAAANGTSVSDATRRNVRLMNPMSFLGDNQTTVAQHWYIRHGSRDRDTAFPIPLIFATRLRNTGHDVDFLYAWNRYHSGDYNLDDLFSWIAEVVANGE